MNRNGQLVLKTLQNMEQPAPILKIIRHVAHAVNVRPRDVKKTVMDTLRVGARYGYVQLVNNKFYTLPPNICRDDDRSSSSESSDSRGDCVLCQRHGGRRRRGGRSRHNRSHSGRSRSRSHSGRNRTRGNSRRSH